MDNERTERAADEVVKLCAKLGLTREETATVAFAVAINHMKATGVTSPRAQFAFVTMWHYREGKVTEAVLVPTKANK